MKLIKIRDRTINADRIVSFRVTERPPAIMNNKKDWGSTIEIFTENDMYTFHVVEDAAEAEAKLAWMLTQHLEVVNCSDWNKCRWRPKDGNE